ncbi:ABC transporter ATP-binding protein [Mangrovicella endophytica]|uniref:ABC transporter ATP-binding protein n=1 Tax=Mangrovicella endophytica TaxID=2066697 RepID=UPI000C9E790E|nr:sn-glycerol-3-phosphate ABC transporter ATP-binding protein UgpC [Mangrovicella endophytica]
MATLTLDRLRKSYGPIEVIHGLDLTINDGEFISLIGASGCGKSTLLRIIAGLEDITDGEISLNGRVINDVAPKDRDIAMVFQNYALYPHLTVRDNMGFSLRLRDVPKAEIEPAIRQVAALLGLENHLDRYPRQLSGGQRQRVAMGRAIVRKPQVFLFDEPLSNLDAKLRVQMRSEIRSLQKRLGTTSIYVTHDQIEAMTMSDRIVVLNGGRIEQVGAPLDLYDRPANLFVATFIGSPAMNLFDAKLDRSGSAPQLRLGELALAVDAPAALPNGADIVLGIRPEHIAITQAGAPGALPVRVEAIEPTGAELQIYGRFGATPVTATLRDRPMLREGDTIGLTFAPAAAHLFDKSTGRRI